MPLSWWNASFDFGTSDAPFSLRPVKPSAAALAEVTGLLAP
ncbi:hypothetical protein ACFQ7G_19670 [Streptomyces massasporeus]